LGGADFLLVGFVRLFQQYSNVTPHLMRGLAFETSGAKLVTSRKAKPRVEHGETTGFEPLSVSF
jgi:hypothetical protein